MKEKYNVTNASQIQAVKDKKMQTCRKKLWCRLSSPGKSHKDKMEQTCEEKYGYKNPQQNADISEKTSKNAYLLKQYIFPNGNKIWSRL